MEIILPDYVKRCLEELQNNGYEAWCVGGAVRDLVMGKTPYDFDVTTNAEPEAVISIFPKTVPTGIKHGTITVVTESANIEVTTYRSDGEYLDNRAPKDVTFVKDIDKDLQRRDFTVNAICYNPNCGIYDPLNGIDDIKNKTIRAIGNPEQRFSEDALRIMRAFRFSAQLGYDIETETLNNALRLSNLLQNISVERIFIEFKRTLVSSAPEMLSFLLNHGAFEFLGLTKCKVPNETKLLTNDFSLRFAALCFKYGLNSSMILRKFKADNITIHNTEIFVRLLNLPKPQSKADIKAMLDLGGLEKFKAMLSFYKSIGFDVGQLNNYFDEIILNNEPYSIEMLAISGDDLINIGLRGKAVGEALQFMKNEVIKDSKLNTRKRLLKLINK